MRPLFVECKSLAKGITCPAWRASNWLKRPRTRAKDDSNSYEKLAWKRPAANPLGKSLWFKSQLSSSAYFNQLETFLDNWQSLSDISILPLATFWKWFWDLSILSPKFFWERTSQSLLFFCLFDSRTSCAGAFWACSWWRPFCRPLGRPFEEKCFQRQDLLAEQLDKSLKILSEYCYLCFPGPKWNTKVEVFQGGLSFPKVTWLLYVTSTVLFYISLQHKLDQ